MVINHRKMEGNNMYSALRSTILDILSELTEIENKKQLENLLNTTKPHTVDHRTSVIYRLGYGRKRKIDIGYYNSSLTGDLGEIISILSHLWRLANSNMLMSIDISVGRLIAVYKIKESIYCAYNIFETENKEIRVCEDIANYELQ